jgi:hypothetical protein
MTEDFLATYNGTLKGVLRWEKLDALWRTISNGKKEGWYLYAVGHDLPEQVASPDETERFMHEVDQLLHKEHDEDYCGIVYTDDFEDPSLVKIYDPGNLGVVCGSSDNPPLPGWIMSRSKPVDLQAAFPVARNRKRWWSGLWQ